MANLDWHYHAPLNDVDSQHVTSGRWFKSSLKVLGMSCVLLTLSVFTLTHHSISESPSTSLFNVIKPKSGLVASPFASGLVASPFASNNQNRWSRIVPKAEFSPGQKAEYYSPSNGRWIPCKIEEVDGNGRVQIDVKKGNWIDPSPKNLRKLNALTGFFLNIGTPKYDVNKALGEDDYVDGSMAQGYARAREKMRTFAQRQEEAQRAGPKPKKSVFGQVTGALDFQENIKEDRGLLASASQLRRGEKMSREESGALQRKVGGTKGGFFGEVVEPEGDYVDKGYVDQVEGLSEGPWWKRLR